MNPELAFIADESVEKRIVLAIRKNHKVEYVAETMKGADDELVLQNAEEQKRILITADKDFGELVYHWQQVHAGIILYRLQGLSIQEKISLVKGTIDKYGVDLLNAFTVISPRNIRIRKQ
jgi:predicted nuclease of predicted toxin-antitoxin system